MDLTILNQKKKKILNQALIDNEFVNFSNGDTFLYHQPNFLMG